MRAQHVWPVAGLEVLPVVESCQTTEVATLKQANRQIPTVSPGSCEVRIVRRDPFSRPGTIGARIVRLKCGLCGADCNIDPVKTTAPSICWDCNTRITAYVQRHGLGAGYCRTGCADCGRSIVARTSARNNTRCERCGKRAKEAKTTLSPVLREKRLQAATEILARQYPGGDYAAPLSVIARRLYKPKWWDSASEIVVAAEILRLGYKVKPQLQVGKHRVDLYIPDLNLIVEVDGDLFHTSPEAKRRDVRFDARAIIEGYTLSRIPVNDVLADVRKAVLVARDWARSAADFEIERERRIWLDPVYHPNVKRQALDAVVEAIKAFNRRRKRNK